MQLDGMSRAYGRSLSASSTVVSQVQWLKQTDQSGCQVFVCIVVPEGLNRVKIQFSCESRSDRYCCRWLTYTLRILCKDSPHNVSGLSDGGTIVVVRLQPIMPVRVGSRGSQVITDSPPFLMLSIEVSCQKWSDWTSKSLAAYRRCRASGTGSKAFLVSESLEFR